MVLRLLREVRAGKVSVEAARDALEGVSLSEEVYSTAVDHGVFNDPEPGSIIRASISPSGDFLARRHIRTLGHSMDPLLGRHTLLRTLQSLGSAEIVIPYGDDSTDHHSHGNRLSSLRSS